MCTGLPSDRLGVEAVPDFVVEDHVFDPVAEQEAVLVEVQVRAEVERVVFIAREKRRGVIAEFAGISRSGNDSARVVRACVLVAADEVQRAGDKPMGRTKG